MESKRIAGRYQIEGLLGRGGMARVYLAVDTMLGRQVAVKVLNSDGVSDPTFVERFRREARSAAQLNHPNIVAVYDWGEEDREFGSTYYMVMEYIDGPTLKQVIADRAPLSEVEALDVAEQVATALDVAHGHGIIHRDVKPHNILLAPDGWVKMTDFGIAQATGVSRLTLENVVTGSPHYLSPEQARGDRVDARSDLYSLGIVLYEMLTGWEPFGGASVQEVLTQHVHEPPPSLREHNAKISAVTESVVGIALAKAPSDRFADAAAMRDALRQARRAPRDETVAAAPIPPPPPAPASNRTAPPPARPARARRREPSGGIHRKAVLPALLAVLVVLGAAAFGAMEALGSFGARPISNVAGKGPRSNPVPSRSHPKDSATVRPVATARPTAKAFARATAVATNPPATAAPLVASTG
ncbi:MAG: protein kinase domain-containing protein, partial [Chloroflexota bacterium]